MDQKWLILWKEASAQNSDQRPSNGSSVEFNDVTTGYDPPPPPTHLPTTKTKKNEKIKSKVVVMVSLYNYTTFATE